MTNPLLETALQVFNETEAAAMLHISVFTMRKWRHLGKGPAFVKIRGAARPGRGNAGKVLYRFSDLQEFLAAIVVPTELPAVPADVGTARVRNFKRRGD